MNPQIKIKDGQIKELRGEEEKKKNLKRKAVTRKLKLLSFARRKKNSASC